MARASQLVVRDVNVLAEIRSPEKVKVSHTLDSELVEENRGRLGTIPFSKAVNQLLHQALAQSRLDEVVSDMETAAGPASEDAYQRVFAQWPARQ
jgi:hypothetical protein